MIGAECLGLYFFSLYGYNLGFSQLMFLVLLYYCSILPGLMLYLFDFFIISFTCFLQFSAICVLCNLLKLKDLVLVAFLAYVQLIWIFTVTGSWSDLVMLLLKGLESNILEVLFFSTEYSLFDFGKNFYLER